MIVNFLLRTNLLEEEAGLCGVGFWTRRWLDDDDASIVIALIHGRVRFVGEMLAELRQTPRSEAELLSLANNKYGFAWESHQQLGARRAWMASAGFVDIKDGTFSLTESGRAFLGHLGLVRTEPEPVLVPETAPEPPHVDEPLSPHTHTRPAELAAEIKESSTDSRDHSRFERAVRDAFAYLGFQAELLAGPGRTDVLLRARLGRCDSYKVVVEAKTNSSGRLQDTRVDWATLVEHREREGADHSLLVGPNPSGARLFSRAADHAVTILSARQLAEQCRRHAQTPLGLDDYRILFTTHGEADLTELSSRAQRSERLRGLAADICRMLAERWATVGYHRARDLWMLQPQTATESEFQSVLDTLASPLVGAVHGDPEKGYVLATDPEVVQLRLTLLGKELAGPEPT